MAALDIKVLCRRLEGRFGIRLTTGEKTIDGGQFDVIRPSDLDDGNSFCIIVSRTHRQIEACFSADNFSGAMLRRMSEADSESKIQFDRIRTTQENLQIYVATDGNFTESLAENNKSWQKLDIDVCQRLSTSETTTDSILAHALNVTTCCLSLTLSLLTLEDAESSDHLINKGYPEGSITRIEVNKYERNPSNRAACISYYGTACQACEFDFSTFYGEIGEGYIQVHHLTPVSKLGKDYIINPVVDLVPLCSNCHSMIHRKNPPLSLNELKQLVKKRTKIQT
ncbi:HNH endonuclease [Pseudomonas sp. HS6]|uniref:HNH endonuclease n=1 Tax=Pseudomonas sp. HS6 TaxID=2850559 RepID=UPI00201887E6|nr:HNH endonuclease [Pseudomonas sp. HS6]UQS18071.1 HNH endonuclease [Pseudomonas sp. HS6]